MNGKMKAFLPFVIAGGLILIGIILCSIAGKNVELMKLNIFGILLIAAGVLAAIIVAIIRLVKLGFKQKDKYQDEIEKRRSNK